ncbi:MAG: LysE family transporter [Candidatus Pacebacteria bacterium]|nr:LysE family transporter [Candidatus Paceibacterota bacterium]
MNIYILQLLTVAGIHALAVISPGPDFVLISKLSLSYSRKIGFMGAIGIALGIGLHVTYSILGIGTLIASSVLLFNTIKILGALYLIYIGLMSFRKAKDSKPKSISITELSNEIQNKEKMNSWKAMKSGFLTNALNPKATLFILAVFTQVINPSTPTFIQIGYGLEMVLATTLWFSIVSFFLSTDLVSRKMKSIKGVIEKITGVVLTALGLKILLSAK